MTFKSFKVNFCQRAGRQSRSFFLFYCLRFSDFLFTLFFFFLNKPEQQCNTEKRKRFHMRMLRYSHSVERLRMHNIYSNLNNIKTFTLIVTQQVARGYNCLSVSLLWHVFLMKCPKFTWSACHHFFSFVFCRPSNGNQPKINVFHWLVRLQNVLTNKKLTVSCGSTWTLFEQMVQKGPSLQKSKHIERGNILHKKKKKSYKNSRV